MIKLTVTFTDVCAVVNAFGEPQTWVEIFEVDCPALERALKDTGEYVQYKLAVVGKIVDHKLCVEASDE